MLTVTPTRTQSHSTVAAQKEEVRLKEARGIWTEARSKEVEDVGGGPLDPKHRPMWHGAIAKRVSGSHSPSLG